jgi:predicted metal-binding protein
MKVGIIRCMQTEDYCPGSTDFKIIREKAGAFEGIDEDIEIVGFISCGGCPGKKAVLRSRELINRERIRSFSPRASSAETRSVSPALLRKR